MFCQSCGAQLTGAFCTRCGARAGQTPPQTGGSPSSYNPPPIASTPPPQQFGSPAQAYVPPPPPPPLTPATSGSGLKILFVVLAIVGFVGMLFIGSIWYGWHRVKEAAASKGVDLNSFTERQRGPGRRIDACELLTREEVSEIVGMNVERAEGGGRSTHSKCTYYSSAAVGKATNAAADALQRMQQTRSSTTDAADQEKALKDVGSMVRGMVGSQSNGLVLSLELETENAKAALAAFKLAMGMMTGGMEKSPALREDIQGLGDEAIVGPLGSIFAFRKGDVAVTIDGRALPGGRDSEVAIAKRIAGKL